MGHPISSPHIMLVSHEASLTGAPKIALNLLRHLRAKTDVELTTILHNGGPLHPEFSAESPTYCMDVPREHDPKIHATVRKILRPLQKAGRKILCICNSAESRFVANSIFTRNIPILYLIHEYPTSYEPQEFEKIERYSNKMIFPCRSVLDSARRVVSISDQKAIIQPQGLLDDQFGTRITKEKARTQIRRTLGLPEDAFIVLGCGTVDLRKGVDHFVAAARTMESLNQSRRPIYFVWVGDGPRHVHSAFHYVEIDVEKSRQSNVRFVGQVENVEPFFVGSDSFLLTSRVDPFPCVIHEAMAAKLPIILFDQSGGAVEAVGEDVGKVVPFGNYVETVAAIHQICESPFLARSMAEKGIARVRRLFQFDHYSDQIIDLCETELGMSIRPKIQPMPVMQPALAAA